MQGIFTEDGIFRGRGIFFSDRGIFQDGGIFPAPENPDPLANIPALFDLRTHNGNKVPSGIASGDGDQNPTWLGTVSQMDQPTSGKQPLTRYESDGTPYLEFDGANDQMISAFASSLFDAQGSFAVAFKYNTLTDYGTPLGGSSGSAGISSFGVMDSWGLGSPGSFNPQAPNATNDLWMVGVYAWDGTSATYAIRRQGESMIMDDFTLPGGFSSAAGFMGIGAHISGAPYSYYSGRLISVRGANVRWTEEQMEAVLNFYYSLLPEEGLMAMAGSENEMAGSEEQESGAIYLS